MAVEMRAGTGTKRRRGGCEEKSLAGFAFSRSYTPMTRLAPRPVKPNAQEMNR